MKRKLTKLTRPRDKESDAGRVFAETLKPPFRGEIHEFFNKVPLGRGYENQGKPLDISTAFYLTAVQREIRLRPFGEFVIMAAVQTLKTLGTIEQPAGFFMANDPGDMTIYFTGDESGKDQSKARVMPMFRGTKRLAEIFDEVVRSSVMGRFDITTEAIHLPGMSLRIWPLNESSVQRLTLRYVLISDAFLSKRTGLITQALARMTQHDTAQCRDYKGILESQGGDEGDDFDERWKMTDQRWLHVRCPLCGMGQPFLWHRERTSEFFPSAPISVPSLDRQAWAEHHRPLLLSDERKHAGMKRGEDVKKEGEYDERKILSQTYYECFHCGGEWRDDAATRLAIDHSSYYVPQRPEALPHKIGFWWPQWCGQRTSWGKAMLGYLQAHEASMRGNYEPIRQWHNKIGARPWSPQLVRTVIEIAPGSYDPNQIIPDEHSRNMSVDCQEDGDHKARTGISIPGWFWYEAAVVDKFGNSRQIARGFAKSWDEWIAVQKKWKIPNDRVVIDVSHWPKQIMEQAAARAETVKVDNPLPPFLIKERLVTWLLLQGSDERNFGKHHDGKTREWRQPQSVSATVFDDTGRRKFVTLKKVVWSNYSFKVQLDAIRSGAPGMPRKEVLGREHLDATSKEAETGYRRYEAQMENEFVERKNGLDRYTQIRPDCHYRDTGCQLLVRQALDGMLGHTPE